MMANDTKTAIVTGASQGIGAGVVRAFLQRAYNVVATSRTMRGATELAASERVALVDGDIGDQSTAAAVARAAVSRFGSIDVLVNNAGLFFPKPFIEYTLADFQRLVSTNLGGFFHMTQAAIRLTLAQQRQSV